MECKNCHRQFEGSATCPACGTPTDASPRGGFVTQMRAKVVLSEVFGPLEWLNSWMLGLGLGEVIAGILLIAGVLALPIDLRYLHDVEGPLWAKARTQSQAIAQVMSAFNTKNARYPDTQAEFTTAVTAAMSEIPGVTLTDPWGLPWVYYSGQPGDAEKLPERARLLSGGFRLYAAGGVPGLESTTAAAGKATGFMAQLFGLLAVLAVPLAWACKKLVYDRAPESQPRIKRRLRLLGPGALVLGMIVLPCCFWAAAGQIPAAAGANTGVSTPTATPGGPASAATPIR